jgi:hypothetical protein
MLSIERKKVVYQIQWYTRKLHTELCVGVIYMIKGPNATHPFAVPLIP